jgi:LuxR family maltose regulon positive regulatory protein
MLIVERRPVSIPLIVTKLQVPIVRRRLVRRAHLVEVLNTGLYRKLTLVSAPAGYGKTTLVAEWLSQLPPSVESAWLSLDEGDNDPARFLSYIIAALRQLHDGFGAATGALLQSPEPPPSEVILTTLVNEIAAIPTQFVLTLDDYHTIRTPAIHQQLALLLEHQPPRMHLVLITREDPLLPVARLRARGQLLEIRQDDLRFSSQECADFFQTVMGVPVGEEDVAALERRTEGWIAGLQLAALSMHGQADLKGFVQAFAGSSRYVLDYLIEEVYERQSAEMQDFLVKTAILDRLSGPLCDAVVERSGSQAVLEALEQANMFIVPLDQSREWYRYHRLFADLLRHRLVRLGEPSQAALHLRASLWYEQHGFVAEAIEHALSAADWDRASTLLLRHTGEFLRRGEIGALSGWYRQIPQSLLLSNPQLGLNDCWSLLLTGQFEPAEELLVHLEGQAHDTPDFLGRVASAQAYLARAQGNQRRMVEKSHQALALLPKSALSDRGLVAVNLGLASWHAGRMEEAEGALLEALEAGQATGNQHVVLTALIFQGRVMAVRGHLHQAATTFQRAIQQGGQVPINALAHLDLSALHYEWNSLEESAAHLEQAIELCQRSGNDEFLIACWIMVTSLHLAQGDLGGARQALERAWTRTRAGDIPAATAERVAVAQVLCSLAKDDLPTALSFADRLTERLDSHSFYRFLGLAKARLLLAQDMDEAAEAYLARLHETASSSGWGYGLVAVLGLQALCARRPEQALRFLEAALELAQPEGYIRTFVEAGGGLVPLLQEAARHGIATEYVGRILAVMGEKPRIVVAGPSSFIEPLSERELEVLRLVAVGLSNREIAQKLVISTGTAKTHVHNICGKLGVRNRIEAAARAKELELI